MGNFMIFLNLQMWLLSHLHLIMVVGGLFMGAIGCAVVISFGVCYSVERNGGSGGGGNANVGSNEQYRPIVDDEEAAAVNNAADIQVVSSEVR
jgi:hypothetical protein